MTTAFHETDSGHDKDVPVELRLSGQLIHNLAELRQHFNLEEGCQALASGQLFCWLKQHYYEREADYLDGFTLGCETDKHRFLEILGVHADDLPETLTDSDRERLSLLRQHTQDAQALKKFRQIALNQEELAHFIDAGEKEIILCKGPFSIPIQKPGIQYVVLPDTCVESMYTFEQFCKAGIKVAGGQLPTEELPESVEPARKAAEANGYDFYQDYHSIFSSAVHAALHKLEYYNSFDVPFCSNDILTTYPSRFKADEARKARVREVYNKANTFFSDALIADIASSYQRKLTHLFSPWQNNLRLLFEEKNQPSLYEDLTKTIAGCESYMKKALSIELETDPEYYHLFEISYFMDKTDVEKHDYRMEDTGVWGIMETVLGNAIEYQCVGIFEAAQEMESDINRLAETFYRRAKSCFLEYCESIDRIMEHFADLLISMNPGESIDDYLERMKTWDW